MDNLKEIIAKQNRRDVYKQIKSSDKKTDFINSWKDHVFNRDLISAYSTIIDNKLYQFMPSDNSVFLPFMEVYPDHVENFIINWDFESKEELYRHNIKYVEMISWVTKKELNDHSGESKER